MVSQSIDFLSESLPFDLDCALFFGELLQLIVNLEDRLLGFFDLPVSLLNLGRKVTNALKRVLIGFPLEKWLPCDGVELLLQSIPFDPGLFDPLGQVFRLLGRLFIGPALLLQPQVLSV